MADRVDVARLAGVSTATVSRVTSCKGYVKREKDPGNKRISKIHITPPGLEKVELMAPFKQEFQDRIQKSISDKDLEICRSVLKQIRDNLEDSCSQQI